MGRGTCGIGARGEPVGGRKTTKISVALKMEFCKSGEGEIMVLREPTEGTGRSGATELGNCGYKGLISTPLSSTLGLLFCTEDEDSTFLRNVCKLLPDYTASHSRG
jgi:hypothetical protein